ncbi:MAG: hypothetical protein O3A84_08725 [Proteobacteria bacterium]|nr:hypothetical protein [Pseudomonadota bacterium]
MFSLPKIIVLLLIVGAVWYGFKYLSRGRVNADDPKAPNRGSDDEPVAMIQCPICSDFVAGEAATNCGKDACPY